MKLFRSIGVLTAALAGLVASVHATERWHTSTVKWVYPLANGDFVLGFDTDSSVCTNVNTPTKYMYVSVGENGVTASGAQKIYAAAIVALTTGKPLSIAFEDATTYCYINRVTVSN